jgi:hypothetical protein
MQLKIYQQRKLCHGLTLLMLMFFFSSGNLDLLAQSCQLSQGQNGGVGLPVVSPITFERGNSNASKSHFSEGNSVPYRVEFTTLEANVQYKIRFGFEVKKNGKYALDYITGFQNLKSTSVDMPETVLPTKGTVLENVAGINMHSFPIPSPNFSSEPSFNSIASSSFILLKSLQGYNPENSQPISGLSNLIRDKGNMSIWNGTIDDISYVGNVNTSLQTVSAFVEVTFTKANNSNGVVLAWGGHIASLQDWGQNNSASSISGSPYHMFVDYVSRTSDGNMICSGNMDCQLLADAVTPVPTCAIAGPGRICAETSLLNYTATLDAVSNGPVNYQWVLTNLNTSASAVLTGITSGNTNDSTLSASVVSASPYFTEGGSFLLQLSVERDGIVNYCYYNSPDSPGIAIKVNDIESSALASPASFSLNNRSTSELSASVLLNGLSSENEFSYQWSLLNPGNYSGSNLSNANARTPTFTTAVADTFNFIVKLTQLSAPNCTDSATVTLVVTPLQQCPTVVTDSVCAGSIGNVYTASFPTASGNTYLWSVSNDAQITSVNGGSSVVVDAGNSSFDLQLKIDYENPDFESLICKYPVTVNPLPVISTGVYAPLCGSAMPISLDGLPSGGSWSGAGVSGNMFDPSSSGSGSHTLIYSYTDANGCSSSDTTSVVVNANPQVEAGSYGPYCASNSPVALQGSPIGGTWSGTNVNGTYFDPIEAGAGTHMLTYTFISTAGCLTIDTIHILVNSLPVVDAGVIDPVCSDTSDFVLTGTPAGGSWSGNGVTGSLFSPASAGVGVHTLVYSYTDANGCFNSDNVLIQVNSCVTVNACTYTQGYYGSKNGNSCDEDSLYNNAISLIKRLLSAGPIVIGSGNSTITILPTDSARVNAIMPGGGSPKSFSHVGNILLTNSQMSLYKGSGGRLNNNLLSQTIALALNLRIKEDLAGLVLETGYIHTQKLLTCNEGSGPVTCQQDSNAIKAWLMNSNVVNYLVENGGATVVKLLDLANAVLGKTKQPGQEGNNGTYVPSLGDITNQIDVINNAFDKCRLFIDYFPSPVLCNSGNYRISEQAIEKLANTLTNFRVLAYPNPFQGVVNFSLESPEVSSVKIDLIDINGKMLGTFFEGTLQAGDRKLIQVLPPKTTSPIIYRIITSTAVYTGKLIPLQ